MGLPNQSYPISLQGNIKQTIYVYLYISQNNPPLMVNKNKLITNFDCGPIKYIKSFDLTKRHLFALPMKEAIYVYNLENAYHLVSMSCIGY